MILIIIIINEFYTHYIYSYILYDILSDILSGILYLSEVEQREGPQIQRSLPFSGEKHLEKDT